MNFSEPKQLFVRRQKKYFRHVLVDENVVRLQVSVDDVVLVQVLQGQDYLGQVELEEDQQF